MTAALTAETLFLPFASGQLDRPHDRTLFLRARHCAALQSIDPALLACEQSFKPDADVLTRAGFRVQALPDAQEEATTYPLVLLLPPRQREEARALMARAVRAAQNGGRVVACASNNEGARSSEADLERLAGSVQTLAKNKCRVFWTAPLDGAADPDLMAEWLELDAPRPIGSGRFVSRPGIFAWDRVDFASELLAALLPEDLSGRAADLGAGFGYLSAELLAKCPGIVALDAYEAEARALDLARVNLAASPSHAQRSFHWHDVTTGLPERYDVIVSNPPFHGSSADERPDIGRRFIEVAATSLAPGGRLWIVANRHLPYEAVLNDSFGKVRTALQQGGYKIIEATRSLRAAR